MNRHHVPSQRGFTIIELLVAFSVLAIMLFLIDQLFFSTSRAISQGVALTGIIHQSNAISEQIHRDSEEMMEPGPTGGIIVILNHKITAPRVAESDYYAETGSGTPPQIRSDQLVYIYNNVPAKIDPLSPKDPTQIWNDTSASHARLWYGHVRRTARDGTDAGTPDLGQPGNNYLALNWILGRQALLLTESVDRNSGGVIRSDTNTGSNAAKKIDGRYDTEVNGYGGPGNNGYPATVAADTGGLALYKGLADIAAWDLGPDTDNDTMLYYLKNYSNGGANYFTNALDLTYGYERLRTNPYPLHDPTVPNYEYDLASWQLAQMHGFFVERISDFEVSFAGDYDATPGVDLDADGNIEWYDAYNPPPAASYLDTPTAGGTNEYYHRSTSSTPALPAGFLADGAFVWRHDDSNAATSKWPYLLRVRYRIHDPRGEFISYDGSTGFSAPGMWFESILAVARP